MLSRTALHAALHSPALPYRAKHGVAQALADLLKVGILQDQANVDWSFCRPLRNRDLGELSGRWLAHTIRVGGSLCYRWLVLRRLFYESMAVYFTRFRLTVLAVERAMYIGYLCIAVF